jgi:hypothetical protein
MVATLDGSSLALYPITTAQIEADEQQSLEQIGASQVFDAKAGRVWSCNFIADDKVAVGLGPTVEPIRILGVTPTGFSETPLRSFRLDYHTDEAHATNINTSVYPIIPLPSVSRAGGHGNTLFLSGAYDGIIRLHDMRSPRNFESVFWDITNDSSIYSLTTHGLEHIIAGTSMHSMLKVFDLRVSGSRAYRSLSVSTQSSQTLKPNSMTGDFTSNKIVRETVGRDAKATTVMDGWNLFLHPRGQQDTRPRMHNSRVDFDSPIYSLSIPSATSPSLYAGVEGSVRVIDFHSVTDAHPDLRFDNAIERHADSGLIDIKKSYNPFDNVLDLGMYEQGNEQSLRMKLYVQGHVDDGLRESGAGKDQEGLGDLDERWKDPSTEGERWTRGHQPQGQQPHGQGRRGRGGRGRGRGRGGARGGH